MSRYSISLWVSEIAWCEGKLKSAVKNETLRFWMNFIYISHAPDPELSRFDCSGKNHSEHIGLWTTPFCEAKPRHKERWYLGQVCSLYMVAKWNGVSLPEMLRLHPGFLDLLLIYQIRKKIVFKQAIYFNRIQFICLMLCLSEGCVYKPQYIFDTMAHACQREDGFG